MNKGFRTKDAVIIGLSVLLCVMGMIVQYEWGKVLFTTKEIKEELLVNIVLLVLGICVVCAFVLASKVKGYRSTIHISAIICCVLMILSCTPLTENSNGIRLLHLGPVTVSFTLLVPFVYIAVVSEIIYRLGETEEYKMFFAITVLTVLLLMIAELADTADWLLYLLPVIGYCMMFQYLKKHKWFCFLPVILILIILGRIVYVYFLPEEKLFYYRNRVIAAWLHSGNEKYSEQNYFMNTVREMAASGGVFGNKQSFSDFQLTYRDGADLLLVGLLQGFGIVGFIIAVVLLVVIFVLTWQTGKDSIKDGDRYKGTVCKGIGVFLIASGILAVISQLYLLPMWCTFSYPFLCVNGFLPFLYLYLSLAIGTNVIKKE